MSRDGLASELYPLTADGLSHRRNFPPRVQFISPFSSLNDVHVCLQVYGHFILNALSLYSAGFAVPEGTLLLGLYMSVVLGIWTGPWMLAAPLICCKAIHHLVAALSGTTSSMFVLYSLDN